MESQPDRYQQPTTCFMYKVTLCYAHVELQNISKCGPCHLTIYIDRSRRSNKLVNKVLYVLLKYVNNRVHACLIQIP